MGNPRIPGDEPQPTIPGQRAETNRPMRGLSRTSPAMQKPSMTLAPCARYRMSFDAHARIYDEE
eukprot:1831235-Prymnesium_polylepis.1